MDWQPWEEGRAVMLQQVQTEAVGMVVEGHLVGTAERRERRRGASYLEVAGTRGEE